MKKIWIILVIIICAIFIGVYFKAKKHNPHPAPQNSQTSQTKSPFSDNALSIVYQRAKSYPGSDFVLEQNLPDGQNYHQYIVSYLSDGLKIYGLLAIPATQMPAGGYPAIIFNHGYIAPQTYETDPSVGQYASYFPPFAEDGYVVFKPDYRGNGNSQGQAQGAYYSSNYETDVLNALSSVKKINGKQFLNRNSYIVNPNKVGMWGHSMGGNLTMRALVVRPNEIQAAVIWSGVVGTYTQLEHWHDPNFHPPPQDLALRNQYRQQLFQKYGTPETNPTFWNVIDPRSFVSDIQAPVQIQYSLTDEEVPPEMAETFIADLQKVGKTVEPYEYDGADHNLSQVFNTAMERTLAFFDKYLK